MAINIDPIDLCARLTLHETLLVKMYTEAFLSVSAPDRQDIADAVINQLRFNLRFPADDGDISMQIQTATVRHAEAFFAKALRNTADRGG